MPRNGSGIYSLPAGSTVANGDTSDATDLNTPLADLVADANAARPVVAGGTGATSASAARANLGLAIGTDVQAYDASLTSIAGLTTTLNKFLYTTAVDTWAVADITTAGRTWLGLSQGAEQRTHLGLGGLATLDILDEDDFASDSATRPPSQQSTKAYVASEIASAITAGGWTERAVVATTSGTSYDETSIPAGVTDIEIYFNLVSASGTDDILVQIGDSGGIEATGYQSYSNRIATSSVSTTTGFGIDMGAGTLQFGGVMRLHRYDGNIWHQEHTGTTFGTDRTVIGSGFKTLSAEMDRLRVTFTGSNTGDNGSFKVRYR